MRATLLVLLDACLLVAGSASLALGGCTLEGDGSTGTISSDCNITDACSVEISRLHGVIASQAAAIAALTGTTADGETSTSSMATKISQLHSALVPSPPIAPPPASPPLPPVSWLQSTWTQSSWNCGTGGSCGDGSSDWGGLRDGNVLMNGNSGLTYYFSIKVVSISDTANSIDAIVGMAFRSPVRGYTGSVAGMQVDGGEVWAQEGTSYAGNGFSLNYPPNNQVWFQYDTVARTLKYSQTEAASTGTWSNLLSDVPVQTNWAPAICSTTHSVFETWYHA